jgi:CTP:molybdopterin cytidylyltransferase MocA
MPQFDTFAFLSQLFWVLLCFSFLYSALAYYLLPAVAITLKIRRRKLALPMLESSSEIITNDQLSTSLRLSAETLLSKEKQLSTETVLLGIDQPLVKRDLMIAEKQVLKKLTSDSQLMISSLVIN